MGSNDHFLCQSVLPHRAVCHVNPCQDYCYPDGKADQEGLAIHNSPHGGDNRHEVGNAARKHGRCTFDQPEVGNDGHGSSKHGENGNIAQPFPASGHGGHPLHEIGAGCQEDERRHPDKNESHRSDGDGVIAGQVVFDEIHLESITDRGDDDERGRPDVQHETPFAGHREQPDGANQPDDHPENVDELRFPAKEQHPGHQREQGSERVEDACHVAVHARLGFGKQKGWDAVAQQPGDDEEMDVLFPDPPDPCQSHWQQRQKRDGNPQRPQLHTAEHHQPLFDQNK